MFVAAQHQKLAPKIIAEDRKKHIFTWLTLALFELGNISQLLSGVGGNIFSMKVIERLRCLILISAGLHQFVSRTALRH
jgi:ribulose 1,5-bisphosphate carboxylase large subunit-like protein